jgi:predicted HTH transcriptional regulator
MISISSILNKHKKGTLYFGLKNDGTPSRFTITDSTIRDVSRKVFEAIKPQIFPDRQPVVMIYPGFLDLRLFDRLYEDVQIETEELSDSDKIVELLRKEGPKSVKELQAAAGYKSRSGFLKKVINPLLDKNVIYRDGSTKSPTALMKLR